MNEAITFQPQLSIWRGARRLDLLARLVRTCRGAAGRGRLGTAEETLISRSTGGRC
jgi:hypothetical protein